MYKHIYICINILIYIYMYTYIHIWISRKYTCRTFESSAPSSIPWPLTPRCHHCNKLQDTIRGRNRPLKSYRKSILQRHAQTLRYAVSNMRYPTCHVTCSDSHTPTPTATHCNTLQHKLTHCNTRLRLRLRFDRHIVGQHTTTHYTATHDSHSTWTWTWAVTQDIGR